MDQFVQIGDCVETARLSRDRLGGSAHLFARFQLLVDEFQPKIHSKQMQIAKLPI